jgi:dihydrolipoamide dehydrogenase
LELPGLPFDGEIVIGAKDALSPTKAPKQFLVIGAGYVGLELSSIYRRLGSEVHIIDPSLQLLPQHDPEIQQALTRRLKTLGIKLHLGCTPVKVEKGSPSRLIIKDTDGNLETLEADKILVAGVKTPNITELALDKIGIQCDDEGFIKVQQRMETNIPGIYAIGDVVGKPFLAHKAYREAKIAAEVIAGNPAAFDNVAIPCVVYTDPEIAWVGLSEKEARDQGYNVISGSFPFRSSGRAMMLGSTEGFVKTIGDADTKRILGVSIVGKDASDLISEAALAIEMGAFLDDLSQTIHPHPSLSEALLESVSAALGEAIHILNSPSIRTAD